MTSDMPLNSLDEHNMFPRLTSRPQSPRCLFVYPLRLVDTGYIQEDHKPPFATGVLMTSSCR